MATRKVTVDFLSDAIKEILEEYQEECATTIEQAGKKVAAKGRAALKNESKDKFGYVRTKKNAKGKTVPAYKYANGWSVAEEIGRLYVSFEIHNRAQPTLTHLLEYGHAMPQGGRFEGREHINTINEQLQEEFVEEIVNDLSKLQ